MNFNSEKEQWKQVKGCEGLYDVSSFGRVRSLDRVIKLKNRWGTINNYRKKGKILTPRIRAGGYVAVSFPHGKDQPIHQLVAKAFVGKQPKGFHVNHKDGNKKNNNATNLEWMSVKDNIRHAIKNGLNGTNKGQHWKFLTPKDIIKIRNLHKNKMSNVKIAKKFRVSNATIMRVVKGITFKNI